MIWIEISGEAYIDEEILEWLEIDKDPDDVTAEEVIEAIERLKIRRRDIVDDMIGGYDIYVGHLLLKE